MQKKTNVETVGAVYTPYVYKINVQKNGSKIEDKKIIKIDKANSYEKNRFIVLSFCVLY